jgi:DNA-binding HxlR family transcriptional regulator
VRTGDGVTDWTDAQLIRDTQVVFNVVSGRWTLPVLAALESGPRRHNELRRAIKPVHSKVLDETLRRMTEQRLLTREVEPGSPPAVFYMLSQPARSLMDGLGPFLNWVDENPSLLRYWREHAQRIRD